MPFLEGNLLVEQIRRVLADKPIDLILLFQGEALKTYAAPSLTGLGQRQVVSRGDIGDRSAVDVIDEDVAARGHDGELVRW
jgi:hypothetical protein